MHFCSPDWFKNVILAAPEKGRTDIPERLKNTLQRSFEDIYDKRIKYEHVFKYHFSSGKRFRFYVCVCSPVREVAVTETVHW